MERMRNNLASIKIIKLLNLQSEIAIDSNIIYVVFISGLFQFQINELVRFNYLFFCVRTKRCQQSLG